jgi:hypothetical protein
MAAGTYLTGPLENAKKIFYEKIKEQREKYRCRN